MARNFFENKIFAHEGDPSPQPSAPATPLRIRFAPQRKHAYTWLGVYLRHFAIT